MKLVKTFNIHEAKIHFFQLVNAVMQGEEIHIAKNGIPVAKLVPFAPKKKRRFGVLKGQVKISKDFDAPLPDKIIKEFAP